MATTAETSTTTNEQDNTVLAKILLKDNSNPRAPPKYKIRNLDSDEVKYFNLIHLKDFPELEIGHSYILPYWRIHSSFGYQLNQKTWEEMRDEFKKATTDVDDNVDDKVDDNKSKEDKQPEQSQPAETQPKAEDEPDEIEGDVINQNDITPSDKMITVNKSNRSNSNRLKFSTETILELNVENIRKYLDLPEDVEDDEIMLAIQKCAIQGLNPFTQDVYLVPYYDKNKKRKTLTLQIGKGGYYKIAESYPDYQGYEAGVVLLDQKTNDLINREGSLVPPGKTLFGGWAKVYREDMKVSYAEVSLDEYKQDQLLWKTHPATMIRKTAITHALREAFPEKFSGVYYEAEMPPEEKDEISLDSSTKQITA